MISKIFSFAGLTICIESQTKIEDSPNFSIFRTDNTPDVTVHIKCGVLPTVDGVLIYKDNIRTYYNDGNVQLMFSSYPDSVSYERINYACRCIDENSITLFVDYSRGLWDSMIFDALNMPDILLKVPSAIMHCSYIINEQGNAVLFAGDSGAGKSTQADLWKRYRNAEIINGDRAALKKDGDRLVVCAVPFCGSSKICKNRNAVIQAIVFPVKKTTCSTELINGQQAFLELIGKFSYEPWNELSSETVGNLAAFAAENIPVINLYCTADENAVIALEKALKKYAEY
ncbi:MAG: hypothetical protein KBT46_05695 [Ruminococcus sp.]|nr:hypothetical protein [Candidatus Copronaster equi]